METFLKKDLEMIQAILKLNSASYEQQVRIVELYKMYIEPSNISMCVTCDGIDKAWGTVMPFITSNVDKFIN